MLAAAAAKTIAVAAGLIGLAALAFAPAPGELFDLVTVQLNDGRLLGVSRYEISQHDWRQCAKAGACPVLVKDAGDRDAVPMTGVNAFDVEAYIAWINNSTGQRYRLPTAAEWRELASELPRREKPKLFDDPRLAWAADYGTMEAVPARVEVQGHFGTLRNGLSDLAGNVWEWTSTCVGPGFDSSTCPAFLVEGEHEAPLSVFIRDPASGGCSSGVPPANVGFRLVRDPYTNGLIK